MKTLVTLTLILPLRLLQIGGLSFQVVAEDGTPVAYAIMMERSNQANGFVADEFGVFTINEKDLQGEGLSFTISSMGFEDLIVSARDFYEGARFVLTPSVITLETVFVENDRAFRTYGSREWPVDTELPERMDTTGTSESSFVAKYWWWGTMIEVGNASGKRLENVAMFLQGFMPGDTVFLKVFSTQGKLKSYRMHRFNGNQVLEKYTFVRVVESDGWNEFSFENEDIYFAGDRLFILISPIKPRPGITIADYSGKKSKKMHLAFLSFDSRYDFFAYVNGVNNAIEVEISHAKD